MDPSELSILLARLEVKLDQLLTVSGDHEARIRNLETRRWPLPVVAVLTGVAALGISVIPLLTK